MASEGAWHSLNLGSLGFLCIRLKYFIATGYVIPGFHKPSPEQTSPSSRGVAVSELPGVSFHLLPSP